MTQRELFGFILKVLALVLIIQMIQYIPVMTTSIIFAMRKLKDINPIIYLGGMSLPFLINGVLIFVAFKYSGTISEKIFKNDNPININLGADWQKPLFSFVLRIIGLLFIISNIGNLARVLISFSTKRIGAGEFLTANFLGIFDVIFLLVLGIYFAGGAKKLVDVLIKEGNRSGLT